MKSGFLLPAAGDSPTRENVLYIAKEAEREGLDSVWVFERLLWPLKPQTPYLGTRWRRFVIRSSKGIAQIIVARYDKPKRYSIIVVRDRKIAETRTINLEL